MLANKHGKNLSTLLLRTAYIFCLLLVLALPFSIVFGAKSALAATPYNASDVLGQVDFDSITSGTTADTFSGVTGVTMDKTGHRLFVSDIGNARVLVFNLDNSNKLIDKTADNVLGQTDFISGTPDVTQSTFAGPTGLAFDDTNDRLFVSDGYSANNRILVFDLSGGITDGMDASWVLGQEDFTSNGDDTTADTFDSNGGINFDSANNRLFVGDYGNDRVLVFDLSGGITDGMDASWVLGQEDFVTDDANTTQDGMNGPWGVHFNSNTNRLYVPDWGNSRVLVFDLSGGITDGMDASWVLGQEDFTSGGGSTSINKMAGPISAKTDETGSLLFVHEDLNTRVSIFDTTSLSNGEDAIGVLGESSFDTSNCETSISGMCGDGTDAAMYFDDDNRTLYVSDAGNTRILLFNFVNITLGNTGGNPVALPNASPGQPYSYTVPVSGDQGTLSCQVTSGSLPPGLTLGNGCSINGTPTTNGTYSFTITATDDNGISGTFSDSQALTLMVGTSSSGGSSESLADTGNDPTTIQYAALVLIIVSSITVLKYNSQAKKRRTFSRTTLR